MMPLFLEPQISRERLYLLEIGQAEPTSSEARALLAMWLEARDRDWDALCEQRDEARNALRALQGELRGLRAEFAARVGADRGICIGGDDRL